MQGGVVCQAQVVAEPNNCRIHNSPYTAGGGRCAPFHPVS